MHAEYSWREKRCHTHYLTIPAYINTKGSVIPTGNAHYSMYGVSKESAYHYQDQLTKHHRIYEHYSSQLIIDVESDAPLKQVVNVCIQNDWSFDLYETGSGAGGGHLHLYRDALPSEILYLRDRCFVDTYFSGIPDIDTSIYRPMHLIRGISRFHERTNKPKALLYSHTGDTLPSVQNLCIYDVLLQQHERQKLNIRPEIVSDWTKLQSTLLRHSPNNVGKGGRYSSLFCLSRDLFKRGMEETGVRAIVEMFNNELENPHDSAELDRITGNAYRSLGG